MALHAHEEEIWRQLAPEIDDFPPDFEPIRVLVDDFIYEPFGLATAIDKARRAGRLTEEQNKVAMQFFDDVMEHDNPEAVLLGLPYENGKEGREVKLTFPHHSGDNGH